MKITLEFSVFSEEHLDELTDLFTLALRAGAPRGARQEPIDTAPALAALAQKWGPGPKPTATAKPAPPPLASNVEFETGEQSEEDAQAMREYDGFEPDDAQAADPIEQDEVAAAGLFPTYQQPEKPPRHRRTKEQMAADEAAKAAAIAAGQVQPPRKRGRPPASPTTSLRTPQTQGTYEPVLGATRPAGANGTVAPQPTSTVVSLVQPQPATAVAGPPPGIPAGMAAQPQQPAMPPKAPGTGVEMSDVLAVYSARMSQLGPRKLYNLMAGPVWLNGEPKPTWVSVSQIPPEFFERAIIEMQALT